MEAAAPAPAEGSLRAEDLPEVAESAEIEALLTRSVACEKTGQLYKFQRRELEFYARNKLPLPRVHWSQRLQQLLDGRTRVPD